MSDRSPYTPLPSRVDLPAVDHEVLELWRERDIFARSVEQTASSPEWVFYEGPPTANGRPGAHHVEARVFKDLFPRFRTMKGYHVPRRAGWDCHGLPVEIAVEKELGLSGKQDIERIGVEEFNVRCRESVQRYVGDFEAMTERVGYWVDLTHAYRTMSPEYIDSVWWALKQISDKGLLVQDHRVAPYCSRCGTGLSDHEVAQGYESVVDPSVFVRLPIDGELNGIPHVDLLIWTTTPWTLVSNTAVAVHPAVEYQVVRTNKGTFVVAEPLVARVLGDNVEVLASLKGDELAGVRYRRPFDLVEIPDAHIVITADYVTTEDGTGLVHQAPAFGADDLAACRRAGLPVVNPIGADGRFLPEVGLVGGQFFKEADAPLIEDLKTRGLLFKSLAFEHQYPHCWRCHTPLMYYAQLSWYIRTTARQAELARENERTNWYPGHIKHGRFGDWLSNNIDWALSRNRYWGTPLPVWQCASGHQVCVGSRAELGELTGTDLSQLEPHRPFVDDITFDCPTCGERATRVPEVIDAWFDSGAMPFAGIGYPYVEGSVELFEKSYPAQFICEAIDQTRGWFYTLMAVGTLVFDRSPYENVVCLGHIMAEDGRKMSKHLGNIVEPIPLMDKHGADALRWFMLCSGSPWSPRRVGDGPLEEIVRKVLLTYWNTASFFTLYASTSSWTPRSPQSPVTGRAAADRWVLAELEQVVSSVGAMLEEFDSAGAGRVLAQFVDDLSNWYVRRSRQRFWNGDPDALATLRECLHVLTRLMAPFVPFITEHVWQHVIRPGDPEAEDSVHLASWPEPDPARADDALRSAMAITRQVVEVGRAVRKATKIRNRQPLSRVLVGVPGDGLPAELVAEIADELNVHEVVPLAQAGEIVDITVKPDFRALGKRFGSRTQVVAKAIQGADHAALAAALKERGGSVVVVDGEEITITPDDVLLSEVPRQGWEVGGNQEVTVALDTTITPELRRAGLAREVIRLVQAARKQAGFEVTDRVKLGWAATGEVAEAVREHSRDIAETVLALEIDEQAEVDAAASDTGELSDVEVGIRFWLTKA